MVLTHLENRHRGGTDVSPKESLPVRRSLRELLDGSFWRQEDAPAQVLDVVFRVRERGAYSVLTPRYHPEMSPPGATIRNEVFCGFIHFMACVYIIPVLPHAMVEAG